MTTFLACGIEFVILFVMFIAAKLGADIKEVEKGVHDAQCEQKHKAKEKEAS